MATNVLIIGGTGAQGSEIVHALSKTQRYQIHVLTRDKHSAAAQALQEVENVTLIEGDSSDQATLRKAFQGIDACYVNTNGFALGEKEELWWGVKTFELAAEAGVKHYVYAGLPYTYKRSGYNPKYNVGHLDGKARVAEFISAQPTEPMNWTIINACMYLELFVANLLPRLDADGETYVFYSASGDGSVPMINLPDLALYTQWVFDHPQDAKGLILDTATEHVNWHDVPKAFTQVTGKPAVYKPISPQTFGEIIASRLPGGTEAQYGEGGMKVVDNFAAFMEVHKLAVPESHGLWPVDYDRLDKILPTRLRSVAEWMKKVDYTGDKRMDVLKTL